jgi:hypothetical protein
MATLVLDSTTKTIKAVMSGAAATSNPEFVVTWADSTSSSLTEGSTDGALNGTTPVTLVAAPASSTRRVIKSISIQNKDSASVTLTISYDNNGTARQLAKVTLASNDTWTTDGVYDTNGNLKTSASGAGTVTTVSVASANGFAGTVANATSTPAITLSTSITGVLKGNGTAISAATAGTDYLVPPSGTAILKANSGGALANASAGTDYVAPGGALGTPSSGTLSSCTVDGTNPVGFRNVPVSSNATNTLVVGDVGKLLSVSAGQTVPNSTFAAGDVVVIFNNSSSSITLTMSITTAYIAGTDTDKATMTLATRGVATILFISGTVCVVSGNVS